MKVFCTGWFFPETRSSEPGSRVNLLPIAEAFPQRGRRPSRKTAGRRGTSDLFLAIVRRNVIYFWSVKEVCMKDEGVPPFQSARFRKNENQEGYGK